MIVPCKRTFSLGRGETGRALFLIEEGGRWLLRQQPADQRDQVEQIYLTGEQIAALVAVVTAS